MHGTTNQTVIKGRDYKDFYNGFGESTSADQITGRTDTGKKTGYDKDDIWQFGEKYTGKKTPETPRFDLKSCQREIEAQVHQSKTGKTETRTGYDSKTGQNSSDFSDYEDIPMKIKEKTEKKRFYANGYHIQNINNNVNVETPCKTTNHRFDESPVSSSSSLENQEVREIFLSLSRIFFLYH